MNDAREPSPAVPSARNLEWWTATVEAHLDAMYRFVRLRVPADATDDLVQEIFVAAARSVSQFDAARGPVWPWLLGIARNKIAAYYRQTQAPLALSEVVAWLSSDDGRIRQTLASETPLPVEICQRAEFRTLARVALSTLDLQHRACLVARYYEDLSLDELSNRFHLSRSAVNSLLYRARIELRRALCNLVDDNTLFEEFGR